MVLSKHFEKGVLELYAKSSKAKEISWDSKNIISKAGLNIFFGKIKLSCKRS